MRELVRGYGAAAFETAAKAGNLAAVVGDLTGFAKVLATSDPLRVALTDGSKSAQVRRDIVADLVVGKAQKEAAELLSYTIRFERPGELSSALTSLILIGEEVVAASSAGNPRELEPQAPHGAVRERVRGFAERVFQELATTNDIDQVEDDLFRFARVLDDNPALRQVLQDVNAGYVPRSRIVAQLLKDRSHEATFRIARYVMRAGRIRDLVGMFEKLVELAAAERGRRIAEVRSAVDLDDAEKDRLSVALARMVERPVDVRVIHDPSVIGGVLISVGDLVIDGTVRIRFERLRDLLAQAS